VCEGQESVCLSVGPSVLSVGPLLGHGLVGKMMKQSEGSRGSARAEAKTTPGAPTPCILEPSRADIALLCAGARSVGQADRWEAGE